MTHVIRLREPWQHTPVPGGSRHTRSFNCPTNLLPGQRVWLVIEETDAAHVSLNGSAVGQSPRLSAEDGQQSRLTYEIASLLKPRNEIVLDLAGETTQLGEVRLEIDNPR
jgi:hypothetical protein